MFMNVDIMEKKVGSIPCLHFLPKTDPVPPTVILYHGWSSNKENQRFLGSILAAHGLGVVAPDAPGHGTRGHIDFSSDTAIRKHFWDVVIQGVKEADDLLETLTSWKHGDHRRLGIVGISMGGYMGSAVFAEHRRFKTFVSLIGTGAWSKAVQQGDPNQTYPTAEQMKDIQRYDPSQRVDELQGRPMLFLHGDEDTIVDVQLQRDFYQTLANRSESQEVRLVETPGLGHYLELDMIETACSWLTDKLK